MLAMVLAACTAEAKVDLVTLPGRDTVQLTIYNSADLTLVRERRVLTLMKGENKLQFSWANTLIDPTSLEILPMTDADKIQVVDLTYPPRTRNLGLWHIQSEISGRATMEISYLTSGLTWRAFYMGTLDPDEKTMNLKGYVRVSNNGGEDYENAQTRMIVGKVHLLDRIAELARREYPYGRPEGLRPPEPLMVMSEDSEGLKSRVMETFPASAPARKEIKKEALSEYFLYTIEGRETISDGWSKRLPSFEASQVPVVNLFKFEEEKYGTGVYRFLSFKNDEEHKLGQTPIPGGELKVFRTVDDQAHLSYEGESNFKYIPVGEDVELNLGQEESVVVKPVLMDIKTDNYRFDNKGNISGWDEVRQYKVEVNNTRAVPAKVEITRNFAVPNWDLKPKGEYGRYEKKDLDTVRFTLTLPAGTKKEFQYNLTTHHGSRAE